MNIPFYRFVKYRDDGHYLFQCLQCGEYLDTGNFQFGPRFCCFCGVEYKGFILPKNIEYISCPSEEKLYFQIEETYDWNDGELEWSQDWRGSFDPKQAIKYLKEAKEERKRDHDGDKYKYRIITIKKTQYKSSIPVDKDQYKRKTGKTFKENNYKRYQ